MQFKLEVSIKENTFFRDRKLQLLVQIKLGKGVNNSSTMLNVFFNRVWHTFEHTAKRM